MGHGAAVGAAGHQDHVRAHGSNPLDLFVGQPSVVRGQDVDDDGAGAQGGALRALAGHVLHHAGDHHLQSAAGAAGGHVNVHASLGIALRRLVGCDDAVAVQNRAPGEFFDFRDGV